MKDTERNETKRDVRANVPVQLVLSPSGINCRVEIDGVDVSRFVQTVRIIAAVHEVTRVEVDLIFTKSDIFVDGVAGELAREARWSDAEETK